MHAGHSSRQGGVSLPALRVLCVLNWLRIERGLPVWIVINHGTELTSKAPGQSVCENSALLHFTRFGRSMENRHIESCHRKIRKECLNGHWFLSPYDTREIIETDGSITTGSVHAAIRGIERQVSLRSLPKYALWKSRGLRPLGKLQWHSPLCQHSAGHERYSQDQPCCIWDRSGEHGGEHEHQSTPEAAQLCLH